MAVALTYLALSWPLLLAVLNGVNNQVGSGAGWAAMASLWAVDALLWADSAFGATCFPFLDKGREVFLKAELLPAAIWRHYRQTKLPLDLVGKIAALAVA